MAACYAGNDLYSWNPRNEPVSLIESLGDPWSCGASGVAGIPAGTITIVLPGLVGRRENLLQKLT
jgi:hypothetical protein